MPRDRFQLTRERSWLVGLLVAALAAAIIFVAEEWMAGTLKAVAQNVGATAFSIGVITVAYDVFIRRSFTDELLAVTQLSSQLAASGIQSVCPESGIDWQSLFAHGRAFTLFLVDGVALAERDWQYILAASRERKTDVRVFLTAPEGDSLPLISQHLRQDADAYADSVRRVQTNMENSWANARRSIPPLHEDSHLQIYHYDAMPPFSAVFVDDEAVIALYPILGREEGHGQAALRFVVNSSDVPGRWLVRQRDRLINTDEVPVYDN